MTVQDKINELREVLQRLSSFAEPKSCVVIRVIAGMEWLVGPDIDTTHHEALVFFEANANRYGGDWALPTIEQLEKLNDILWNDTSGDNIDMSIKHSLGITGYSYVWTGTARSTDALGYGFIACDDYYSPKDDPNSSRCLLVRPVKQV